VNSLLCTRVVYPHYPWSINLWDPFLHLIQDINRYIPKPINIPAVQNCIPARFPFIHYILQKPSFRLFGWLVADDWCWFVLREEYCWLVAGGLFVLREKYCWLMADKPSEQGVYILVPDDALLHTTQFIKDDALLHTTWNLLAHNFSVTC
jgi:hypothetical protein